VVSGTNSSLERKLSWFSFVLSNPSTPRKVSIEDSRINSSLYTHVIAFTLFELETITKSFRSDYILEEGGFGTVYKGYIDENVRVGLNSLRVAIKVLNKEGLQGHRECFFKNDEKATLHEANLVNESCLKHGFFQVINHGIDPKLLALAYEHGWVFFQLPLAEKSKCKKKEGSMNDFSNGHAHRFAEKLPWKECLTFEYHENDSDKVAAEFFTSTYGSPYKETGYDVTSIPF
ncbi:putative ent-kaurene synthase, partial [Tanacetum coccineum]